MRKLAGENTYLRKSKDNKKRPSEEGLKHGMLACFIVRLPNYYTTFDRMSQG